jgi:hypothetical protein
MFCKKCGKRIPDDATYCPYCGEKVDPVIDEGTSNENPYMNQTGETPSSPETKTRVFAILSLVFGALGGLLGLIFGILGLTRHPNNQEKAMCIVGISLWVCWVIYFVVYVELVLSGKIQDPYKLLVLGEALRIYLAR